MSKIHPTAIVDPSAELDGAVEIGPYAVVEGDVRIGGGTVIRSHAVIRRYTEVGENNQIDSFVVLGGGPQDYGFKPGTISYVKIGDNNVFREGVTINRATGDGNVTVVGNNTMWMANSHAGHNAIVADNVICANGVALGGYSEISTRAILSGGVMIHQFTWIGDMVMTQGMAGASCHVPPYCLLAEGINVLVGLNSVGLRRADHISREDHRQIKEAFNLTYRSHLPKSKVIERMDACTDWGAPAMKFRDFIHKVVSAEKPYRRGLCKYSHKHKTR
ncbi:MAG: acyl-ACP--UDP-N-acetylglucosamine O-acyltransferase [Phycisphaerae bacterium]|nr:acyl-ACP--UDP-N-acetylglucosamine O-acyltransferase [Phycisphaerae bacterium]